MKSQDFSWISIFLHFSNFEIFIQKFLESILLFYRSESLFSRNYIYFHLNTLHWSFTSFQLLVEWMWVFGSFFHFLLISIYNVSFFSFLSFLLVRRDLHIFYHITIFIHCQKFFKIWMDINIFLNVNFYILEIEYPYIHSLFILLCLYILLGWLSFSLRLNVKRVGLDHACVWLVSKSFMYLLERDGDRCFYNGGFHFHTHIFFLSSAFIFNSNMPNHIL